MTLLHKIWPVISRSQSHFDQQTRDSLNKLATVMGLSSQTDYDQIQQQSILEHMRTENDYLRNEIARSTRAQISINKQLEIANMKCDILFQEMLKYIEEGERVAITFSNQDTTSSLNKINIIEQRLEKASDQEHIEEVWGSVWRQKIIGLIEKIDVFEKEQLDSLVLDDT